MSESFVRDQTDLDVNGSVFPEETPTTPECKATTIIISQKEILPDFPNTTPHEPEGYEILNELGRGGMAIVYKAHELKLNRIVAIKMLRSGIHASTEELKRFRLEAEVVAQLKHPNIVQIHSVGDYLGVPFLSLELIDGGTLETFINGKPHSPEVAIQLVEAIARGVHAAHQKGIIHRDLKPSNILMTQDHVPKIADFGVAKLATFERDHTQTGVVMGTPCYIAPEKAKGVRETTPGVDVYALGVILYELLTGRPPFTGATPLDTVKQVIDAEPVPPSRLVPKLHRDLEAICLQCLEKSPERRYTTAEALAEDLRRFRCGESIQARPISGLRRILRWSVTHPRESLIIASLFLLVGALGFSFAWVSKLQAERQNQLERTQENQSRQLSTLIAEYHRWRQQSLNAMEDLDRASHHLQMATTVLSPAKSLVTNINNPDLHNQLQYLLEEHSAHLRYFDLLREIEKLRLRNSLAVLKRFATTREPFRTVVDQFLDLFLEGGIDLLNRSIDECVSWFKKIPMEMRIRFIEAMDTIAMFEESGPFQHHLLDIANTLDSDDWRKTIRDCLKLKDHDQLLDVADNREILQRDGQTCHLLGDALLVLDDDQRAISFLELAVQQHPNIFWLNHDLGIALEYGNPPRVEEAIRYITVARSLRPQLPNVHFNLAIALERVGRFEEAIRSLEFSPGDPNREATRSDFLANCYWKAGKRNEAMKLAKENYKRFPNQSRIIYRLADFLHEENRVDEAKRLFEELLELPATTADDFCNQAIALTLLDRKKEAIAKYEEGHQKFPTHFTMALNLAALLNELNHLDRALEVLQRAHRMEPYHPKVNEFFAQVYEKQEQFEKGLYYYRRCVELDPTCPWKVFGYASLLRKMNKPQVARFVFEEAIRKAPKNHVLHYHYGLLLRDLHQKSEAEVMFRKTIQLNPNWVFGYQGLGSELQARGAFQEALELYQEADRIASELRNIKEDTKKWVKEAEQRCKQFEQLKQFDGKKQLPQDPTELIGLANFYRDPFTRYNTSTQLFRLAFERYPQSLENLQDAHRWNAACAAVLAGTDQGTEVDLDEKSKSELRDQGYRWLTEHVDVLCKELNQEDTKTGDLARRHLQDILKDQDFESVRTSNSLQKLPESERTKWQALWNKIRALLKAK
jgi:eukaryotic-like serine/threonine-protein kinase